MSGPVSVIVPIGPGETAWRELTGDLHLPAGSEIILCPGNQPLDPHPDASVHGSVVRTCGDGHGRAGQMNAGARVARNTWLWFLHADSRLGAGVSRAVERVAGENREALYFFDLRFMNDGPAAMRMNEWAVGVRAGTLGMPFGDQGFLIRKDLFELAGGYREDAAYGEDHLLVWKVRQLGYPVLRAGADILTSARKYRDRGWLPTTFLHVRLTIAQAVPEWIRLVRGRLGGGSP